MTTGPGQSEATGNVPPRAGRSGTRPRCEQFPQAVTSCGPSPNGANYSVPRCSSRRAALLAAWDAGSQATFVTRMSAAARGLGLGATDEPSMIHVPLLCCAAGPRRATLAGDKKGMIHEQ